MINREFFTVLQDATGITGSDRLVKALAKEVNGWMEINEYKLFWWDGAVTLKGWIKILVAILQVTGSCILFSLANSASVVEPVKKT